MSNSESTAEKYFCLKKAIAIAAVLKKYKSSVRGKSQEEKSSPLVSALTQILHDLLIHTEQDSDKDPLENILLESSCNSQETFTSNDVLNSTQEQFHHQH